MNYICLNCNGCLVKIAVETMTWMSSYNPQKTIHIITSHDLTSDDIARCLHSGNNNPLCRPVVIVNPGNDCVKMGRRSMASKMISPEKSCKGRLSMRLYKSSFLHANASFICLSKRHLPSVWILLKNATGNYITHCQNKSINHWHLTDVSETVPPMNMSNSERFNHSVAPFCTFENSQDI